MDDGKGREKKRDHKGEKYQERESEELTKIEKMRRKKQER